jgi:hypothetical protein
MGRSLRSVLLAQVGWDYAGVIGLLTRGSAEAVVYIRGRIALVRLNSDLRPFAQPIGAIHDHSVSRLQTRGDLDAVAVSDACLHLLDADRLIRLDQENEGSWRAVLDRRDRRNRHILEGANQEPRIDELVRKQSLGKVARSLMVPVVVSISLSTLVSVPVAISSSSERL